VCLLFAFQNQPTATPRAALELHSRDGPEFQGIAGPNIPRTEIQRLEREGVRPNAGATEKGAAQRRRLQNQPFRERRSARASSHRLLSGGVVGPPGGGVRGSGVERRPHLGRRVSG